MLSDDYKGLKINSEMNLSEFRTSDGVYHGQRETE